jgi:hypothetical protein
MNTQHGDVQDKVVHGSFRRLVHLKTNVFWGVLG